MALDPLSGLVVVRPSQLLCSGTGTHAYTPFFCAGGQGRHVSGARNDAREGVFVLRGARSSHSRLSTCLTRACGKCGSATKTVSGRQSGNSLSCRSSAQSRNSQTGLRPDNRIKVIEELSVIIYSILVSYQSHNSTHYNNKKVSIPRMTTT